LPDVRLNNDTEAAESLDAAFSHFVNFLEHVARFHPAAIRLGYDLEVDQAISHIWIKNDIPQVSAI
jgi:hypothetical protein